MRGILGLFALALSVGALSTPALAQQPDQQRLVQGLWLGPGHDTNSRGGTSLDQEIHNRDFAPQSDTPPDLPAGADVHARTGGVLGTLAGVAWNEQEGLWYVVITDPRDRRRFTLASTLWLDESGAIASNLTPYQFRRLPELPQP